MFAPFATIFTKRAATLAVTATIDGVASSYEGYEPKIALAADAIWVSDAFKPAVARVDPQLLRVTYRRAVAGNGITVGAGAVWSADGKRSVWRFAGARLGVCRPAPTRSTWLPGRTPCGR